MIPRRGALRLAGSPRQRMGRSAQPLRLGVVGLVHGHVEGLLWQARRRDDLTIVGVYEPDRSLFRRLARKYDLEASLHHESLDAMLELARPEAVSVMTAIADHVRVAETCAPRGVHMLLEKPLALDASEARRMAALARRHGVHILTNFETSWYGSVRETQRRVSTGWLGPIRRMEFRHGHRGPREIGCAAEFVSWLIDPVRGGGALVDFACYGALLATWLMNGQRPMRVVASATTLKPRIYPDVADDATLVLTYPTATAVISASWAWTRDVKETDVYCERRSIHAGRGDKLAWRSVDGPLRPLRPRPRPRQLADEWTHLRSVVHHRCAPDPLASLDLNLVAVEIIDEAVRQVQRRSQR